MNKTFKVSFVGRKRGSKDAYSPKTVIIKLSETPKELNGILPELNKKFEVWQTKEIWERIF